MRQSATINAMYWMRYVVRTAQEQYAKEQEFGDHLCIIDDGYLLDASGMPGVQHFAYRKMLLNACGRVLYVLADELLPYYVLWSSLDIVGSEGGFLFDARLVLCTVEAKFIDA